MLLYAPTKVKVCASGVFAFDTCVLYTHTNTHNPHSLVSALTDILFNGLSSGRHLSSGRTYAIFSYSLTQL